MFTTNATNAAPAHANRAARRRRAGLAFAALACASLLGAGPAAAYAGFCGNYVQTSSNAGACPTCRLQIADNPKIQLYLVEANNGWSAKLNFVEGDPSVATGSGQWRRNVGHAYAGKRFDIDMSAQGKKLTMRMTVSDRSIPGTIVATFRCLD